MSLQFSLAVDPQNRTQAMGIIATRGGEITLDKFVGEMFKWLHVGVAGDVIIEGVDGTPIPIYGATAGMIIPIAGFRVLTSAVINSVTKNTTATGITWYGGV